MFQNQMLLENINIGMQVNVANSVWPWWGTKEVKKGYKENSSDDGKI